MGTYASKQAISKTTGINVHRLTRIWVCTPHNRNIFCINFDILLPKQKTPIDKQIEIVIVLSRVSLLFVVFQTASRAERRGWLLKTIPVTSEKVEPH